MTGQGFYGGDIAIGRQQGPQIQLKNCSFLGCIVIPVVAYRINWCTLHLDFGDEFQVQLDQGQAEAEQPTRHGHLPPSNSWINYPELNFGVVLNKSFIEYPSSNAIAKCVFQCARENQTEPANCRYEEAQKEYEKLGPSTEGKNLSQMRHFDTFWTICGMSYHEANLTFCTSSGIITYAAYMEVS